MKTKTLAGRQISRLALFIPLVIVALFSCQKKSVETLPKKTDMATVSSLLGGNLLTGNVMVESDENEIAINYNNGNKYILIAKIPHTQISNINNMQLASIITSKYGIILNDLNNGKVYFLMNNDSESLNEFESVQAHFTSGFQSDKIFGTTIINSEKD